MRSRLMQKRAFVAPTKGELSLTILRSPSLLLTLSIDLNMPIHPNFKIDIPLNEEMDRERLLAFVTVGMDALREQFSIFMVESGIDPKVVREVESSIMEAFNSLMREKQDDRDGLNLSDYDGGLR